MTEARGDVRSKVEFEGANQSAAGLKAVEDHLRGIATTGQATETRLRSMAKAGEESKNALLRIGEAFTPFRRNLEVINQLRGAMNVFVGAARGAAHVVAELAERTPRTKTELERLKTAAGQVADEFARGLDSGRRFSGMLSTISGDLSGSADAARTLGVGISGLIDSLGELNRIIGAAQTGGLTVALRAGIDAAMRNTRNAERFLGEGGPAGPRGFVYDATAGVETETLARPGQGRGDQGAGSRRWGPAPRQRRSGGGGRRDVAAEIAGADTSETMFAAMDALFAAQEQLAQQTAAKVQEVAQASLDAQLEAQVTANESWMSRNTERLAQEQQAHEARLAMIEAEAEAYNSLQEKARQEEQARYSSAIQNLQGFAQATGSISDLFGIIADAEEERNKKSDGWRKAVGVAKGIMYQIEAGAALAQGLLAIGQENYGAAVSAFAAVPVFEAMSIKAFRDLAQTGGGGGGPRTSAGTYTPTTPSRIRSESDKASQASERVVVIGLGTTDADVAAAMTKANYSMIRAGKVPLRPGSGVGYQG